MLSLADHLLITLEFAVMDTIIATLYVAYIGPRLNAKRVEDALTRAVGMTVEKLKPTRGTNPGFNALTDAREEARETRERNAAELEILLAEHVGAGASALFKALMPDAYKLAIKHGPAAVEAYLPKLKALWDKKHAPDSQSPLHPWMQP